MASVMIYATGEQVPVRPENGKHWQLRELQKLVGGFAEYALTNDGRWMVLNAEGNRLKLPYNPVATKFYIFNAAANVVGNVVIVDNRYELDGDPEDE